MARLLDVAFPNGEIFYVAKVPEVPATTETKGNVTINNMGSPGVPSYFEVSFRTVATFDHDGVHRDFYLTPSIVISGHSKDSTFREIESKAARSVAPMLRAIADEIEQQVKDYDEKQAEKASNTDD